LPERDIETSNSHIPYVTGCCIYSYQYFIILGDRFGYLFELKNFWWSVFCAYDCFHFIPLPISTNREKYIVKWMESQKIGNISPTFHSVSPCLARIFTVKRVIKDV